MEKIKEAAKDMSIHQIAELFKMEVMIVSTAEKKMIEDFRKGGWYMYKEDK